MDRIALDILGPLPLTSNGNEYILVVGDYFTKYSEAYSIPNHTALTVADKLFASSFVDMGFLQLFILIKVANSNPFCSRKCVNCLTLRKLEPLHIIPSLMG